MIVGNITTLKKHVSTIVGDNFDLFNSHVSNANQWLKNNFIGDDLYKLADEGTSTDKELKTFCERIVSLRAYETAIPFIDLVQTDSGFAVASSDSLAPASSSRVKALTEATKKEQDTAIEELLAYLEKTNRYHDKWKESHCFTLLTDTYLHTLEEFERYASFTVGTADRYPKSRRDYAALNGTMRDAIFSQIEPVISPELNDELLNGLRQKNMNNANRKLLEPIRFALACFALGLYDKANEYLRKALSILKANPELYPTWRDSAIGSAELNRDKQENDKPIFFAGL
ncbi:MAG: hypothetical protein LBG19_10615 [Prevotellaceae bacterium]|jgi:tetratricopeptide (TPR) repeat protein|nr:hypothetical protein [Prevotellaceae bacterium]